MGEQEIAGPAQTHNIHAGNPDFGPQIADGMLQAAPAWLIQWRRFSQSLGELGKGHAPIDVLQQEPQTDIFWWGTGHQQMVNDPAAARGVMLDTASCIQ